MRNPTMKESSMESKDDARNLALLQKFKDLQNMWESQQKSRPRLPRTCSTASYRYRYSYSSTTVTSSDHHRHLFQTSPATLMSSLQRRNPAVRIKNCSVEVEEILMDRRDAIVSGRFKGRQLFTEKTSAEGSSLSRSYSGGGGGMCSDWVNGIRGREVMTNYELSSGFRGSRSLPEAKAVVEVAEKRGGGGRREEKGGGGWVATASLGAVLIVLALLLICSLSSNGDNFEELIPT